VVHNKSHTGNELLNYGAVQGDILGGNKYGKFLNKIFSSVLK